jgi:large subunit ribosomal protein L9e
MVKGVVDGYRYKMRLVYAHFPMEINIENDGKEIEIRNFLGEMRVRVVTAIGKTIFIKSATEKETILVEGIDLNEVSQSAASIQQCLKVKNKDIRKFLDGIYVSATETLKVLED